MFYVHSLLSTRVFDCSIWISQENICGHICFGTNEGEKYESPACTRFIKNYWVIAHFVLFQVLNWSVSKRWWKQISICEYMGAIVWFDPTLVWNRTPQRFSVRQALGPLKTMRSLLHEGTKDVFSFVISKSQIGLKTVYFICYECLVGQQ